MKKKLGTKLSLDRETIQPLQLDAVTGGAAAATLPTTLTSGSLPTTGIWLVTRLLSCRCNGQ